MKTRVALIVGAAIVAVAGLAITAAVRPNLVRNTSTHPRTWALAAAAIAVLVLVGWIVYKITKRRWPAYVVSGIGVLVLIALVVVPTFRSTTVDEADPLAGVSRSEGSPPPSAVGDAPPAGPRLVATAEFVGIDHTAEGVAKLIDLGTGERIVRLENFDVEPGPDYRVYFSAGSDQQRPDGGIELGALKGTRGDQNYELPDGVDIGPEHTLLIWCRAFAVPVANATIVVG